ncbi:phenylacetate-CoA ligase [Vibrio crassostreae]|uniref:phenylacetate--CoA ligase family protein n=1 Tax=Vibrio crassostreae TaxID=246167 RepID=UPI00105386A1|nr:phenylacetate--CoA ligase family protein [Vibrio crassostreae]TCN85191.1 phenylacetate-CoA ligase [Vibrio crassostreae]
MSYINKLIYKLGERFRNPSLARVYSELKNSEFSTREELERSKNIKLKELLLFSYENSEYYRALFDSIGYKHKYDDILNFFPKLPISNKRELIDNNESIHTYHSYDFSKLFFSETSGSSGEALTFYKDELWDSYNRASIYRGLSWFGVKPYERNGYFWGFNFGKKQIIKVKILDSLMNRFRLFSYSKSDVEIFLKKLEGASYVHGYSSMIYEVAKIANKNDISLQNLKLIKGTSEKIYDHYHVDSLKAFGCKIVSEYGSAESGIIAFECPFGKMHINEETVFVEVINGKAIITNLIARSFPTIRYELGDYIELSDESCDCGRSHLILKEVTGRIGKNIIGRNQEKYPSLTLYYVFKNLALQHGINLSYRCYQNEIGVLQVYLEKNLESNCKNLLDQEFEKYFSKSIDIEYFHVESIREKGKKLKDFDSSIV